MSDATLTLTQKRVRNFVFNKEMNHIAGLGEKAHLNNLYGFFNNIYGDKTKFIFNKIVKPTYRKTKDVIKKRKNNIFKSKKINEIDEKYSDLYVRDAFYYAMLTSKFKLTNEDLKHFENIIDILVGNHIAKARERLKWWLILI